ncbi:MAG TPA: hypothetical protein VFQ80_11540 [Thermomicrobiales bacterium]|nr:hypothetical protein [Thermomicrobiales bacterium]
MAFEDAPLRIAHAANGGGGWRQSGRSIAARPVGPRVVSLLLAAIATLALLAACVEDDSGSHQFANDLRTPNATSAALATPDLTLLPTTAPLASPVSAADLLRSRGAPSRIYFLRGGELWSLSLDNRSATRVVAPAAGQAIVGFDASPSGDKVAVAFGSPNGRAPAGSLLVVDAGGRVVQRVDDLSNALKTTLSTPNSVDWSPQGKAILLGFRDGGIASVPIGAGAPRLLLSPAAARRPQRAAWSPTGQDFAFLNGTGASQPTALYRAAIAAGTPTPTVVAPSGDSAASVAGFAWLPDGRSLLFTQVGGALGSGSTDLWQIGVDGKNRKLVASAGVAAPVAQVSQFAPSTDGRSVAYAIDVPTAGGPVFNSLWLRDLAAGRPVPVPMPSGVSVVRLWWTSAGLVVEARIRAAAGTPAASDPGTTVLLLAPPAGRMEELLRFETHPAATPVVATPLATPAGSGVVATP